MGSLGELGAIAMSVAVNRCVDATVRGKSGSSTRGIDCQFPHDAVVFVLVPTFELFSQDLFENTSGNNFSKNRIGH